MKEQIIRRNIFEAGKDDDGKAVTFTATFRGYTAQESLEAEHLIENVWKNIKELLQLADLPKDEVTGAAMRRY